MNDEDIIEIEEPTLNEVTQIIENMKKRKSSGSDMTIGELINMEEENYMKKFTNL